MSQEETLTEAEKKEAREKLKERFGGATRVGGKGTERRKKKVVKSAKQEDKKVMSIVKKYSPQPLDGITEVNMFKDDNTVIHFTKPSGNCIIIISSIRRQGKLRRSQWNS